MFNLPNLNATVKRWEQPITLYRITKTNDNGWLRETREELNYNAVVQPLRRVDLMLLREGQRQYKNQWLHSSQDIKVENDDLVVFKNDYYRVMKTKNYEDYGFTELFLIQDKTANKD